MAGSIAVPQPPVSDAPTFARITCATNGTRGSAEAVRQALALAGPDVAVNFVAVTDVRGVGLNRMAGIGEHRARQALDAARALARDKSVHATTELMHAHDIAEALLALQDPRDLLVVGSHGHSRAGGVLTGSVATSLVHRTTGSLLVSRPRSSAAPFPAKVLVAVEERRGTRGPIELAARIAAASGGEFHQVPIEHIGHVAAEMDADLVVVGRRRIAEVAALERVSERLVHATGSSVLIAGSAS
jgi:nucleotide-binding universal stress UspA family protein